MDSRDNMSSNLKGNDKMEPKKDCNVCDRLGLKPFTKPNILYYYIPAQGVVSYGALSINIMNPSLSLSFMPKKNVTDFLLAHTVIGTTMYLYSRPHLRDVPNPRRIGYSLVGSSLFTFGSVLIWAIIRSAIPKNDVLASIVGAASGFFIFRLSYDYLKKIDSNVRE